MITLQSFTDSSLLIVLCASIFLVLGLTVTLIILISRKSSSADTGSAIKSVADQMEHNFLNQIQMLNQQHEQQLRMQEQQHSRQMAELREQISRHDKESARSAADSFQVLSDKILRQHQEELKSSNSEQLSAILDPLKEKIESFSRSVSDSYIKESAAREVLSKQIEQLMSLNATIGKEANQLTSALKGNSKVQGDWGEMILATMLENAGLIEGQNFATQYGSDSAGRSLRDEEGNLQRPDVVVFLPDDHKIIIDSKVSLSAFVDMCAAGSEDEEKRLGKLHLNSVKRHIDELAAKSYQKTVEGAAEQVLMFIPNEGAYYAAVRLDPNLWKYAFDRNIVVVSPTHIFSVMQIVAQLWRQEKQNRNAAEIAKLGGLLYDKFVAFTKDFEAVEAELTKAQKAYDRCRDDLTKGGTSLTSRADRLRRLGAKTSKRLPQDLIGSDYEAEEPDLPAR